jgi:hypothetical protein
MGHVESFSAFFLIAGAFTRMSAERELDASVCVVRLRRLFCALVNLIGQSLSGHALRLVAVVALFLFCGTASAQRPHTLTGDILVHKNFYSKILNNDRDVKADLYGRMLVEELKPFIDSHYRTKRDAKHTGQGGSSLGGLVSIYLGPEVSCSLRACCRSFSIGLVCR